VLLAQTKAVRKQQPKKSISGIVNDKGRLLQRFGIGFRGVSGGAILAAKMENIRGMTVSGLNAEC
jgi:hypothetical protein